MRNIHLYWNVHCHIVRTCQVIKIFIINFQHYNIQMTKWQGIEKYNYQLFSLSSTLSILCQWRKALPKSNILIGILVHKWRPSQNHTRVDNTSNYLFTPSLIFYPNYWKRISSSYVKFFSYLKTNAYSLALFKKKFKKSNIIFLIIVFLSFLSFQLSQT